MQIKTFVDSADVTFMFDDELAFAQRTLHLEAGKRWLRDARRRLTRAIAISTRAMVEPTKVPGMLWELFHVYLGGPILDPKDTTAILRDFNPVLAAMGKTLKGLSGDLTITDMSHMPGIAKAQVQCMHAICWAKGQPGPEFAGLVFVDVVEMAGRYLGSLWKDPGTASGMLKPYQGAIHLNFGALIQHGERSSVVTTIHEGTHKFAQTTDEQYFPDEGAADLIERGMEASRPMIAHFKDFAEMRASARKIALNTGAMREAYANVQKMASQKALNNADGIAQFVYEVSDLPTAEETAQIVRAVMKGR